MQQETIYLTQDNALELAAKLTEVTQNSDVHMLLVSFGRDMHDRTRFDGAEEFIEVQGLLSPHYLSGPDEDDL